MEGFQTSLSTLLSERVSLLQKLPFHYSDLNFGIKPLFLHRQNVLAKVARHFSDYYLILLTNESRYSHFCSPFVHSSVKQLQHIQNPQSTSQYKVHCVTFKTLLASLKIPQIFHWGKNLETDVKVFFRRYLVIILVHYLYLSINQ